MQVNNVELKGIARSPGDSAANNSDSTLHAPPSLSASATKPPDNSPPGGGRVQPPPTSDLLGGAILVDVLGGDAAPPGAPPAGGLDVIGSAIAEDTFFKFVSKNNGVLFENDLLQIGVKSEFRQNLGRLTLFYGNKTSVPFSGFVPAVECSGPLATQLHCQVCAYLLLS